MSVTKRDLVRHLSSYWGLPQAECSAVLEAMLAVITSRLAMDRKIEIRGFGSFEVRHHSARTGRNVHSGNAVAVPAFKTVKVRFPKGFLHA